MQERRPGPPRPFFHFGCMLLSAPGIAVILAGLTGCAAGPAAEGFSSRGADGRPSLTNAEYEMQQLRALGAIGDARSAAPPPTPTRATPDLVRGDTFRLITPVRSNLPKPPAATGTPSATVVGPQATTRSGPVQKVGSSYIGPGGATSRRVGSIMLNSDGTTGQLIGNTIINH